MDGVGGIVVDEMVLGQVVLGVEEVAVFKGRRGIIRAGDEVKERQCDVVEEIRIARV